MSRKRNLGDVLSATISYLKERQFWKDNPDLAPPMPNGARYDGRVLLAMVIENLEFIQKNSWGLLDVEVEIDN